MGLVALRAGDRQVQGREDGSRGATGGLPALSEFQPPARLRGIEKSVIRQLFDRARPNSINLGLGEPDLPTPEVIRRAAIAAIAHEQNGYTSHAGLLALRERIAADNPHLASSPEQVIVTAGSQEALYLAL